MKKKSKFRHIQIDKKKYYFYEITWVDPTGDSGWADAKTFGNMTCSNVITNAYVFKKIKNIYGLLEAMTQANKVLVIVMFFLLDV